MENKKSISLISGLAAAGLLIPGLIMVFKSPAGLNIAIVILASLHIAAIALSLLGSVLTIARPKVASVVFTSAGIVALLCLLLLMFMLLSMEIPVILTIGSVILIFVAARNCAKSAKMLKTS